MQQLTYKIPSNEIERLTALRRYEILDTPPDGSFDRITSLCAKIFNVPIALVTLVDEDRIWFKSRFGLDAEQVDREAGLCASAIMDPGLYVVNNAALDPRTLANPLVAGELGLRFYAAAPLRTHDGFGLGNLCIIDKQPRDFSAQQLEMLQNLSGVVMDEMELRIAALQAIQKKDEFMALASHELRTPLSTAKAYVELAAMLLPGDQGEVESYVQKANNSLDRLSSLITDLTDVSKVQHGRMMLRKETIDLDELVEFTIDDLQPTQPTHKIVLTGSTGAKVTGDHDRLQQVLINLLTNAVKYSPGKEKVEVTLAYDGSEPTVIVKDNGIGIAQEHLTKIFDRFHREKMVQNNFQGMGVGLYIAAEIVKRHGGKLSVSSRLGKGSAFTLSLPPASN